MSSEAVELLSVAAAAKELELTDRAIRHRIKAGTLVAVKLGPGTSSYVITRAEVDRAKAEQQASA
jgi:peptidyl-tRNA hydrolase